MKEKIADKLNKCTPKQKVAIITALIAFGIGWGLTIAGFIVPPLGEVSDSVLWILGQALIYAASIFGVTTYFSAESKQIKKDIGEYFELKEKELDEKYQQ